MQLGTCARGFMARVTDIFATSIAYDASGQDNRLISFVPQLLAEPEKSLNARFNHIPSVIPFRV